VKGSVILLTGYVNVYTFYDKKIKADNVVRESSIDERSSFFVKSIVYMCLVG
jgi:hypothetical protein